MTESNPLIDLKEILVNMRSSLTAITESKIENLNNITASIEEMINTANQMEMEKKLLDTIESIKSESNDVTEALQKNSDQVRKILREYL